VDQIVGKSMKDGDTTEDGSMMGRLGRVEKQVRMVFKVTPRGVLVTPRGVLVTPRGV
jgi:hypothetical protein